MARILVTGSADGLGRAAAATLLDQGHEVVVHLRHRDRMAAVQDLLAGPARLVIGDLADAGQTHDLAAQANALGPLDAVIHNAGVYTGPAIAQVNVLAPYLLTALIAPPRRLVYLSSGLHRDGHESAAEALAAGLPISYADSKLCITALALALARRWPQVASHAVDPGWVPTRMGGPHATDDLREGHWTQEWLVTADDPGALAGGGYWYHRRRQAPHAAARDPAFQERLLDALAQATGVVLPMLG